MSSEPEPDPRKRCCFHAFIAGVERSQRIRIQRRMFRLCDENRRLGGKEYKKILREYGLKESDIWAMEGREVAEFDQPKESESREQMKWL